MFNFPFLRSYVFVGLSFMVWSMLACDPSTQTLPQDMEDPAQSHGSLDPEAQEKLANPQKTHEDLKRELEELRQSIRELENQIDTDKLEDPKTGALENLHFQKLKKPFIVSYRIKPKNVIENFKNVTQKYVIPKQIFANMSQSSANASRSPAADADTPIYMYGHRDLVARVESWASQITQELDNGTRECDAWFLYLCKYEIRRLKHKALEWINLPSHERENLRIQNAHFTINPDADERLLGSVDLGPELVEVLNEMERRDKEAQPIWARQVIDNPLWPDLSDEQKVERWADETLQAFEARKADRSWLDPKNFHWYYTRGLEEDRVFLREWIQKTPNERDQDRLSAQRRNRLVSQILNFYEEDETLKALWQSIEANDRLNREERNRQTIRQWVSYEFSIRESMRRNNEGVENFLFDISGLPENLRQQLEDVRARDANTRRQKVLDWTALEWEERQSLNAKNEGISTKIAMSYIDEDLGNQIQETKDQDEQRTRAFEYTEAARQNLEWWTSLDRCHPSGNMICLEQSRRHYRGQDGIRNRLDVSRLTPEAQEVITNLENNDLQNDYEEMKTYLEELASLDVNQRQNLRQKDQPDPWDPLYHSKDGEGFRFLWDSYEHIPELRQRLRELESELDNMLSRINQSDRDSRERLAREQREREEQRRSSQAVELNQRIREEYLDDFKSIHLSTREWLRGSRPRDIRETPRFLLNQAGLDEDLRAEVQKIEDEDIQARYEWLKAEIQRLTEEGLSGERVNFRKFFPSVESRRSYRVIYSTPMTFDVLDIQGIRSGDNIQRLFRRPERRGLRRRGDWFPDYRSGSQSAQRRYYEKVAPLHNELIEQIRTAEVNIEAERERIARAERQESITNFFNQWTSNTFQDREKKRLDNSESHVYTSDGDIGIFIRRQRRSRNRRNSFRVSLDEVTPEQKARILEIEEQDNQARQTYARQQIAIMSSLTPMQRFQGQQNVAHLNGQIDTSRLSDELKGQIEVIEQADQQARDQLAKAELSRRTAMSYDERSALEQRIGDLFDISSLSESLQREIRDLQENDREIAENRRRASEWAARKAREARLNAAIATIQDQRIAGYREAKVKLWPIRCNNSNNPVYPYTNDRRPMHLNIRDFSDEGMKLEIRNDEMEEHVLLAEGVKNVHLRINKPRDLYDASNHIEYESQSRKQTYRLNQLVDIQNTRKVYYIRVVPGHVNHPLSVQWDGIDRVFSRLPFRGEFRIEITDRRSSNPQRSEWSLINVLPIEWYLRSVVASESRSSFNVQAHLAQAVTARSYFLNKALEDRSAQSRGWDIDPTQCNQVYKGANRERQKADMGVAETTGLVVTYNGRLAQTQYYACGTDSTKRGNNFVERRRNIPSNIRCEDYSRRMINNHGKGMPQIAANYLTQYGWHSSNDNRPTEEAKVPENIHEPWSWRDVLNYFYRGEHPAVKIEDFRNL